MNYKHILLAFAMACFTATSAEAQNKSNPARKAKATATNADSLQVRKLIDAAKQGDEDAAIAKIQEASDAINRLVRS